MIDGISVGLLTLAGVGAYGAFRVLFPKKPKESEYERIVQQLYEACHDPDHPHGTGNSRNGILIGEVLREPNVTIRLLVDGEIISFFWDKRLDWPSPGWEIAVFVKDRYVRLWRYTDERVYK